MTEILEQEAPTKTTLRQEPNVRKDAIAQRLAQFRRTMALIESLPNRRAEAGLGPLPDDAIAAAYEEREAMPL